MLPNFGDLTKGQTYRRGQRNTFILPVALLVIVMLVGQGFWLSRNTYMFLPFEISRIDCDACTKLGTVRDPENPRIRTMCQACFGVGYHTVRKFDDQDVLCLACGGIGRLASEGAWRTCNRCGGRGVHRVGDWKEFVDVEELDFDINAPSSTSNNPPAVVEDEVDESADAPSAPPETINQ